MTKHLISPTKHINNGTNKAPHCLNNAPLGKPPGAAFQHRNQIIVILNHGLGVINFVHCITMTSKERHGVPTLQSFDCSFNKFWRPSPWWRHQIPPVPVNSPHKGQWRGALMFSVIWVWINGWVNNREAGDLRRHRGHYDVNVMLKRALKLRITGPLWGESNNDRWIPSQRASNAGKIFHIMTSSWISPLRTIFILCKVLWELLIIY